MMKTSRLISLSALVLLTGVPWAADDVQGEEPGGKGEPYTVNCERDAATAASSCIVDRGTYVGWRTYHAFCHVCHAQDAVGSTFAPSLIERLKHINKERFLEVTANGYTGQTGVMPGWKDNPNVSKRYEELWSYLKARSDGVLAPGRPEWKRDGE